MNQEQIQKKGLRVLFLAFATVLVINFAVLNSPEIWFYVNLGFLVLPVAYFAVYRMNSDKLALAVMVALAAGVVYQYFMGKALETSPDLVWQIIDTVGILIYAYLAGSRDGKLCSK